MEYSVQVEPFGEKYVCEPGQSLLEGALRQGYYLRYGCKHGGCGTCKAVLLDGDVSGAGSTFALSSGEAAEGWVLLCASRPESDCVVEVTSMELTDDEFHAGDQLGSFEAEVTRLDAYTPDIRGLTLRLPDGEHMPFTAGQFLNIEIPGTSQVRCYSMAGAPQEAELELIVKLLPGGRFSECLESELDVGSRLTVYGPLGELKLRLSHRKVLMVAGGSGLAPFLSMLRDLEHKGKSREIDLVYGARRREDLYQVDQLERLVEAHPSLTFTPVLVESDEEWTGETGLVTDLISRRYPSLEGYDAYLAGPPAMVEATIPLLLDRGVRERNIHFDAFLPAEGPGSDT